jgi:hypothetical protein
MKLLSLLLKQQRIDEDEKEFQLKQKSKIISKSERRNSFF